jgi:CubicO group peptidase (beta-lactamase class C family)
VRELLAHRSGIYSQRNGMTDQQNQWIRDFKLTLETSVRGIANEPLLAEPGKAFAYSGAGYCVAGRVAEIATGTPFDRLLQDRIGGRLGWKRTGYFLARGEQNVAIGGLRQEGGIKPSPDAPHLAGAEHRLPLIGGSLYSTVEETARFARMVLNDGRFGDTVVLPKEAWKEFLKHPHTAETYGLGWFFEFGSGDEVTAVRHNGALSG